MTVRHFDGAANAGQGERIVYDAIASAPLSAAAASGSPLTQAVCWRSHDPTKAQGLYKMFTQDEGVGGSFCYSANPFSDGFVWYTNSGFQQTQSYADEEWQIAVFTRPVGTPTMLRSHRLILSTGVWSHVDEGNLNNSVNTTPTWLQVGRLDRVVDGAEPLYGDIAGLAFYDFEMNDAAVEAAFTDGLQGWLDANPIFMPDLSVDELAQSTDLTGNGADQLSIIGTTAVEGEDPPNFDLSLGPVPEITIGDLLQQKLGARYPAQANSATALLLRYRADQGLHEWEQYVGHVAGASASLNFLDDQKAFWKAFVP